MSLAVTARTSQDKIRVMETRKQAKEGFSAGRATATSAFDYDSGNKRVKIKLH